MPDRTDPQMQAYLSGLWSRMKDHAAGLSTQYGPSLGGTALSPEQEQQLWGQRALTVQQEWDLWRQGRSPETTGQPILTPEEIGLKVFPQREKLAKSGGRLEPKQWFSYVDRIAQKAEQQRQAVPTTEAATGVTT